MVAVRGRLAPEVGAVLRQALTAARDAPYQRAHTASSVTDPINKNVSAETFPADVPAETPTMAQQQADALAAETALHHGIDPGAGQCHHIRHWANGGPTTLSNLALLCRRHHRAVHEEGYQVEGQADGELCFRRPDGGLLPQVSPPPTAVPGDPVHGLRERRTS